jgi:SAM-dependent methyltransferase
MTASLVNKTIFVLSSWKADARNFLKAVLPSTMRVWLRERQRKVRNQLRPLWQVRDFKGLRRVTPISNNWGWDRGQPVDKYYIENFLSEHALDVKGHVLTFADDSYARRFGGERVCRCDVLNLTADPRATIIADLTNAGHLPSNTFDCVICTQVLLLIYDVRAAIQTLYRILKPGGVLLVTIPGVGSRWASEEAGDYWRFTSMSARRLFEENFSPKDVEVRSRGNVLAAIAFLHGLASEELYKSELDYYDRNFELVIMVRAVKTELGKDEHGKW